jgi:hypothetical protein
LPTYWVSLAYILGLFCTNVKTLSTLPSSRRCHRPGHFQNWSLLPIYWVSFALCWVSFACKARLYLALRSVKSPPPHMTCILLLLKARLYLPCPQKRQESSSSYDMYPPPSQRKTLSTLPSEASEATSLLEQVSFG